MLVGFADCWFAFGYCMLWLLCCFRFVLFMLFLVGLVLPVAGLVVWIGLMVWCWVLFDAVS